MKLKDFLTPVNVDQLDFSSTIIILIHQRSKTLDEMEFDCCREEIEIIGRVRCDGTLSHVAATQGGGRSVTSDTSYEFVGRYTLTGVTSTARPVGGAPCPVRNRLKSATVKRARSEMTDRRTPAVIAIIDFNLSCVQCIVISYDAQGDFLINFFHIFKALLFFFLQRKSNLNIFRASHGCE